MSTTQVANSDQDIDINQLRSRRIEGARSDQVLISDLSDAERSRLEKTARTATGSIQLLTTPGFYDQLDESKVSKIPPVAVRVTDVVQNSKMTPAKNDLETTLAQIAAQRAILADESIDLPIEIDAELTDRLGSEVTSIQKRGILIQINEFLAYFMVMISELNNRDRQRVDHMKTDYGKRSDGIGTSMERKGAVNLLANVGGLFVRIGSSLYLGGVGQKAYAASVDAIGQQIPTFGTLFATRYDVKESMERNRLTLLSGEIQNVSSKSSEYSSLQNALTQVHEQVRQWLTAAASSK